MTLYLIRKFALLYAAIIIMMTSIAVAGGVSISVTLPKAVFYAGFLASGMTWYEIRRKGLWPLYDNLRISRRVLFAGLTGGSALLYLILRMAM